ncbi:MAG: 50S ribosomal protein L21 [Oscillospiraceae bacterium]|nr:50S ribosomal protein L21 [Candidatus Equicaccousia limihippi]
MYAIMETGGKQYRVQVGDEIFVEKLTAAENEKVEFDKIVALKPDKGALKVGKPYVADAKVEATVIKNGKGKKITVFTYKPKKGCARKIGHRQPYTKIKIDAIG